ncbi:MAG TPA: hypothetical protein VK724_20650 [Bryobacteraceae bacterium]|jgi:uncharacterized membrane-anchored protein|nr:hypothetical protein [Bryobacteraceae bacterium]
MQPITIITAGIFFVVLYLRFQSRPKDGPRRSKTQKSKMVKVLVAAIVVWLAVSYSMQHTIGKMDGTDHEPSFMERAVSFLSSHL